ncbi:MAG: type II secretion system F family protein [Planctomycetaceae bacterium]
MNHIQMWLFMTHQSEPLRQTSLLMLLAGGIGHGETLLHSLRAHEAESNGDWANKIGQLRLMMEQGHSLASSMTTIRDLLPDQTVSAIRTAESTGTLADVLVDEAKRISGSVQTASGGAVTLETLLLMMFSIGTAMFCVVSFLMVFIIPKYKEIFYGFGVTMPSVTVTLIEISDKILSGWFLFILPLTGCACTCLWWMYSTGRSRLIHGHHRLMEHWPGYWVPGVLRQLSLSAATGHPLGAALDSIMINMPPGRAAERISGLRHRVMNGEDTIEALQATRLLGDREAAFLRSAVKTRHLDWGLRHLAEAIESRRARIWRRIPTILAPMMLLVMGLMVMFVCVAFFAPLIKLLNDLS